MNSTPASRTHGQTHSAPAVGSAVGTAYLHPAPQPRTARAAAASAAGHQTWQRPRQQLSLIVTRAPDPPLSIHPSSCYPVRPPKPHEALRAALGVLPRERVGLRQARRSSADPLAPIHCLRPLPHLRRRRAPARGCCSQSSRQPCAGGAVGQNWRQSAPQPKCSRETAAHAHFSPGRRALCGIIIPSCRTSARPQPSLP